MIVGHATYMKIHMLVLVSCYMNIMQVDVFIFTAIVVICMLMDKITRLLILVCELL